MNIREEFGKRLKVLRKGLNMSQDKLASISGIDRGYISEIETGKSAPTIDLINKLAQAMNVQPLEFFVFSFEEPEKSYSGMPKDKSSDK